MLPALVVETEAAALQLVAQAAQQRAHVELAVGELLDVVAQFLQAGLPAADRLLDQAPDLAVHVAQMRAALLVDAEASCLHRLGKAGDDGAHLGLALRQFHHQLRFGAHLVGQATEALDKRVHLLVGLVAALLAAGDDALEVFQIVGGLFEKGLDIDGDRLLAVAHRTGTGQPRALGQPILEFVEEPVLCLACQEFEIAQHERARKTEQRSAEGRAHAGQGLFQARLQLGEKRGDVATGGDGDGADGLGHAADRAQKTPERAQQAQEHHEPDEVAGDVAAFIEAGADAVEQ
jgi:hypothetical protein